MYQEFSDFTRFQVIESTSSAHKLNAETRCLVLINQNDFNAERGIMLDKILQSVGFITNQTAEVINIDQDQVFKLSHIRSHEALQFVLIFGIQPKSIGLMANVRLNNWYTNDGLHILVSHSLEELEGDKRKKMALWTSLQKIKS